MDSVFVMIGSVKACFPGSLWRGAARVRTIGAGIYGLLTPRIRGFEDTLASE